MGHRQMFWRKSWIGLMPILVAGIGLLTLLGGCCTPGAAAAPAPPQVALVAQSGVVYVSTGYGSGPGAVFGRATAFQASDGSRRAGDIPGRFLGASNAVIYVTRSTQFQALKANDHSLLWQYQAGTVDTMAVDDQTVYLASHSTTATVVALRASDGAQIWQYQAAGVVTRLAEASGVICFVVGGSLVTLRASDGALLWQQDARSISITSLTVEAGAIYLDASRPGEGFWQVEALRASDGALLWQHKSDQGQQRLLATQSGVVYLGIDASFKAVRASDGSLLWQQPIAGATNAAVTVQSSVVYLALKGLLHAFRASDGALLWQQPMQTSIEGYTYALAAAGDVLYLAVGGLRQGSGCAVTTSGFVLQAERASDGKLLWSAQGA